MNKWKVAFVMLVSVIIVLGGLLVYFVTQPVAAIEKNPVQKTINGTTFVVQTTTADFEKIALKYLSKTVKKAPIPVHISMKDDIQVYSDITFLGMTVPVSLHFDPIVDQKGNIELKQTQMYVGALSLPPDTALKLIHKSGKLPKWMQVLPNEEEIYVDLSQLHLAKGAQVKAKEMDLANNKILLHVTVPIK